MILLFYPLFYVAVLPYGIFALVYLIPMAALFGLIYPVSKFKGSRFLDLSSKNMHLKTNASSLLIEKLRELKSMLDEGLITQKDYNKKKEEILKNFK